MRKIVVSLFIVATSAAHVWDPQALGSTENTRRSASPAGDAQAAAPERALVVQAAWTPTEAGQLVPLDGRVTDGGGAGLAVPSEAQTVADPQIGRLWPRLGVTLVQLAQPVSPATPTAPPSPPPATPPNTPQFKDGTYTGSPANAYYGTVQVRVVVKNGQVASIDVLNYPSDRSTSRQINSYALPQLQREVVQAFQAQSARIRIISGATLTTEAYLNSVQSALKQALVVQAPAAGST
jgi:uncharacterized protein with FMN-binding domain